MKERNILKRLDGNHLGWVVGFDDENEIIVEAPTGERGWPTEAGFNQWVIYAAGADGSMIQIPESVMHFVHLAKERREKARRAATRAGMSDCSEKLDVPTLADLGFDDNPRVDS